jgi:tetratricopeptide (TPR) repeat protein
MRFPDRADSDPLLRECQVKGGNYAAGCAKINGNIMKINRPELLLVLLTLVLLALMPVTMVADFDLFFHLRLGESLWEKGELYRLDEFSYTTAGSPQSTGEWLSNALIYAVYRHFGFTGLGVLKSVMFLVAALFVSLALRLLNGKDRAVPLALSMLVFAYAMRFRLDLRPYYFTYIFLSAFLYLLIRHRKQGGLLYLLPLIQILWSNTHGGSMLGPMMAGTLLVTEAIRMRRIPVNLLATTVLVLAASWLNPESIKDIGGIGRFSPLEGSGARELGEWQPLTKNLLWGFGLRYTLGYQILVAGSALFLIREAIKKRFDPFQICLFAAALIYPIKHVRLIPLASILLMPTFYGISRQMFDLVPRTARARTPIIAFLSVFVLYLTVFSIVRSDYHSFGFGPKEGAFPEGAIQFLDRNGIDGNAFNTVTVGSYMLWRSPHRKVFIDGRLIQSGNAQSLYDKAIRSMEGFRELDGKYHLNYAVLDYDPKARWRFPLHLNSAGEWALVYWDRSAVVYVKRNEGNRNLIEEKGYKLLRPYFNDFSYLDRYLREDRETVLRLIDEDIGKNPENQETHLAKAFVSYYFGLRETVFDELRESIRLAPDTAFEHISMAQFLMELGKTREAEKELRRALRLEPHNTAAREMLGRIKQ